MIKKLSKFGNSNALIIDKPIMDLLGINKDTKLEITTDGNTLVIRPLFKSPSPSKKAPTAKIKTISKNRNLQRVVEKNLKKYDQLLKKLAKN